MMDGKTQGEANMALAATAGTGFLSIPQSQNPGSNMVLRAAVANEVIFAVVGYVGSGTNEIAETLKVLLERHTLDGGLLRLPFLRREKLLLIWQVTQAINL
jgi:hypothetical protein